MSFCLTKDKADLFKQALKKGEIDPVKLSEMDSDGRRDFFSKLFGDEETSRHTNTLFESKLLLKNQQQGFVTWATNLTDVAPKVKADLLDRIGKLDKVLSPADEKVFLRDLAEKKLGVGVSFDEAQKITELAKAAKDAKAVQDELIKSPDYDLNKETDAQKETRLEYGRAAAELDEYVTDLKKDANKITWQDFKDKPVRTILRGVIAAPGQSKGINAAFDNSAVFRQGWKTMFTNPIIWQRNGRRTFVDMVQTFGSKNVERELKADILSRPNYDLMKKAKLDVAVTEEDFPTSLPTKVPLLGRVYKASENAYSGFVKRTRADIFDKMIDAAKKTGVDLNDTELIQIGRLVNALTGRGDLGKLEQAGSTINSVFFSPKFLKSHIDVLTQPMTGGSKVGDLVAGEKGSKFVRKQASFNLAKIIIANAGVLALAKFLKPDSVELDPRSSDFGKIRFGDTRFDLTGGMGSLAVLSARLLMGGTKSTADGKITPLNARSKKGESNPMAKTGLDLIEDFFENKTAPAASVMVDILKGETRSGYPITYSTAPGAAGREAINLFTPLPVKNAYENLTNPNAAPFLLNSIADGLGIAASTYSSEKDLQRQIREAQKAKDDAEVQRLTEAKKQVVQDKKQNNPVLIQRKEKLDAENEKYPELKKMRDERDVLQKAKKVNEAAQVSSRIVKYKKDNGIK